MTNKSNKTIGFGINNNLVSESGYTGIFINVVLDSVTETLILNDDGTYNMDILKGILSHSASTLYVSGEKKENTTDKQAVLESLGIK